MFGEELISEIADRKTPCYAYDLKLLESTATALKAEAERWGICVNYALKANCESAVLRTLSGFSFGADCVSGNEVSMAVREGFSPAKICFAGVGKTDSEILAALNSRIGIFVVESIEELPVLDSLAASVGLVANVMLRINPNINAHTHKFITTGTARNKFGIPVCNLAEALDVLRKMEHLQFVGLHSHVGSQITCFDVFASQCIQMNSVVSKVEASGFEVKHISLGGGLGIDYYNPDSNPVPDFGRWLSTIGENLKRRPDQTVHIEPGRSLVAQCGSLLTRVLYVKNNPDCRFLILDAGMNDLLRPALYGAVHKIENLSAQSRSEQAVEVYDVVGPVCESSDVFARDCELPSARRGDIVAIRSAGAYGATMSSRYNLKDIADTLYV